MDIRGHGAEGLADGVQVEDVVAVTAIGRAAPHGDQARVAQPSQVIRNQAGRLAGAGHELACPKVPVGEQADDRPAQVVCEHPEHRGRRGGGHDHYYDKLS